MAATRRDITTNSVDAGRFVQAVLGLKAEPAGIRASEVGITAGPLAADRDLSTWDLFVIWHVWAMQQISADGRRNAAHMGPVFLPWHRWYMLVLEANMRRILGVNRDDFGLPYWNWAADGTNFTPVRQRSALAVWGIVGGNGPAPQRVVTSGPFVATAFDVRVEQSPTGTLRATNRGLRRNFGSSTSRLPRQTDVDAAIANPTYDTATWDTNPTSLRNMLEGWVPSGPRLHNQVHVWIGGDMAPGSSPNDPIFFLNHCYVDRLWETWKQAHPASNYQPTGQSATSDPLYRHRSRDPIYSILTRNQPRIDSVINVSTQYVYA